MAKVNVNELRIGNIVNGASRNKPCVVTSAIIKCLDENQCVYNPIEVTGEWLCDFGFEAKLLPISNVMSYNLNGIVFNLDSLFNSVHVGVQRLDDRNYKYIHQLQNLVFCITGYELQLNKSAMEKFNN